MQSKVIFVSLLVTLFSCNQEKKGNTNSTADSIELLKKKADSFYYAKNDVEAITWYSKLIKLDSTKGEYFFHRGASYSTDLNAYPAIQDFLKAIELGYKVADSYRNIAVNYFSIDDSLAVYYIDKSFQIDTNDVDVRKLKQKYELQLKKDKLTQKAN
jgi:tetratricopeptide (TPR) repeat protein